MRPVRRGLLTRSDAQLYLQLGVEQREVGPRAQHLGQMFLRRVEHEERSRRLDAGAGLAGEQVDRLQHGSVRREGLKAVAGLCEIEHLPDGGGPDDLVLDQARCEMPREST